MSCVYLRAGELYRCAKCGDQFVYPNCLRAHLRFRCRYRKQQPKTSDVIACRQPSPRATSGAPTPPSGDKMSSDITTSQRVLKRKAASEDNDGEIIATKRRSSPNDVPLRADVQGPRVFDVGRELNGPVSVSAARAPSRSAFQRVDKAPLQGPTTPPSPSQATSSSSPSDVASITPTLLPLSVVTTSNSLTALDIAASARHTGTAGSSGLLVFPPPAMQPERMHAPVMLGARFAAHNNRDIFYPTIRNESAAAYARHFVTNNNNNVTGNDVKLVSQSSLGAAAGSQSRHAPLPPPPSLPLPLPGGLRTSNPMMEKLLQLVTATRSAQPSNKSSNGAAVSHATTTLSASFPSLQLAQNWCAKCNTSFRMTSDLVYHMRTHHKRDLDPTSQGRRKDDNKLRCDVCGETFKERHHLTRHMTSHT